MNLPRNVFTKEHPFRDLGYPVGVLVDAVGWATASTTNGQNTVPRHSGIAVQF
jgi:hypothetical protein